MWTSSSTSSCSLQSSSTSSSPSPHNYHSVIVNNNADNPTTGRSKTSVPKTMEEVWKDIGGLATDDDLNHHYRPSTRGVILQDFLSRAPVSAAVPSSRYASSPPVPPPPPPPPTILTLSSVIPDHHHVLSSLLVQPHRHLHPISHVSSTLIPDDSASGGNKRLQPEFDRNSGGDRRNKRMIKNRESAARSRARKQAYTNELELEVANLLEENSKLKKQQQQLYLAAAAKHQKKKNSFHRTSSAPF